MTPPFHVPQAVVDTACRMVRDLLARAAEGRLQAGVIRPDPHVAVVTVTSSDPRAVAYVTAALRHVALSLAVDMADGPPSVSHIDAPVEEDRTPGPSLN